MRDPLELRFMGDEVRDNEDIVRKAVTRNPKALDFASDRLRAKRSLVRMAAEQDLQALQYAEEGLRSSLLPELAIEPFAEEANRLPTGVLSVRYSWDRNASMVAARMHNHLSKKLQHIWWYSGNTYEKGFCGPDDLVVDKNFKCDGAHHGTCMKKCCRTNCLDCRCSEASTTDHSCWRFSFWTQLLRCEFMVQILEWSDEDKSFSPGKGQDIESEMAEGQGVVDIMVFRIEVADEAAVPAAVDKLASEIKAWEEKGRPKGVDHHKLIRYEDYTYERQMQSSLWDVRCLHAVIFAARNCKQRLLATEQGLEGAEYGWTLL